MDSFKAVCYETSVYQKIVELKEDSLTSKGYIDLAQLEGLYVEGAGNFLRNLRLKNQLSQKAIAKIVNGRQGYVSNWEKNDQRILLKSLVKIAEALGVSRDLIYQKIDQGKIFTKSRLPVKWDKICDVIGHISPVNTGRPEVYLKKCTEATLKRVRDKLNVYMFFRTRGTNNNKALIHSSELYKYLTSFFQYKKVYKLKPPLNNEVKIWYDDNVNLKRAIIIPCLQSDGTIDQRKRDQKNPALIFSGNNRVLHDYFIDAMYYEYKLLPTSYFTSNSRSTTYYTLYNQNEIRKIIPEIMELSGNSKTSPAVGQSVEEYLQEPQPHLDYLNEAIETVQKIALRIWASTEGCIGIHKTKDLIYPKLAISCAHPVLASQLKLIAKKYGINFYKRRRKTQWSGIKDLINSSLKACILFLEIGGFINGVRISSYSPYHEGIEKNILTLGILEYIKQRKTTNRWPKIQSKAQHHYNINRLVENEEYYPRMDYYIDYFS